MTRQISPFHAGEIEAQHRAGVAARASQGGRFIRDHMPLQHRDFFAAQPFLVVAGSDTSGKPWVSILEGKDGPVAAHTERSLILVGQLAANDPLAQGVVPGAPIGILGIELATKRRNRVNGRLRSGTAGALVLDVQQSFGNCAQYIHERTLRRVDHSQHTPEPALVTTSLNEDQKQWIAAADTLFIGSGFSSGAGHSTEGFDASHRGGEPGFVGIDSDGKLHIPDYAGNNFFNTIGNLVRDPKVGLLFVDFATGGLLQLSGHVQIIWDGSQSHDPQARRKVVVTVDSVVERPQALALRWHTPDAGTMQLLVTDKVVESPEIMSVYLARQDGHAMADFTPGQHLPLALKVPGQPGPVRRSYSLSGPADAETYRISVKREAHGIASRFLHDVLKSGDMIDASSPSGDFIPPEGADPLVLVSAGVGVTPMLSILHGVVDAASGRPVWFVHGTRNRDTHAFRQEVADLGRRAKNVAQHLYYSAPSPDDQTQNAHVSQGRVTADALLTLGAGPRAHYMICGPTQFVADLSDGLERLGVSPAQIHYETFGPVG
ncbi:hypothetical protein CLV80_11627 [Yoonia maritima]|uniref:nitric oxide dioxygenase n=1 Tax=Yoonia maritima TaxID=1435347 RepID=A0A2T0VTQ8_9RHOB|nr:pyridoxamine 5'-phosphate oxidase family protein [Yoonia maritima]PRY74645.1 hypothetical protein CLV80_11627 [Yoonia maritima]